MTRHHAVFWLFVLLFAADAGWACRYTPQAWQQPVDRHAPLTYVGQRKHTTWARDRNLNFVDDEIEARFRPGDRVSVLVALNRCVPTGELRAKFSGYGRIGHIGKLITFVRLDEVAFSDLTRLAALPDVAMVHWNAPAEPTNDVVTRAVQARSSETYRDPVTADYQSAEAAGLSGDTISIAIVDTGVDDADHPAFTGSRVAGFDATDPGDPADGSADPDDEVGHGTHVAAIALGRGVNGESCSTPDDGSTPLNCAGVAPGARLVDVKIRAPGGGPYATSIAEGLDWVGLNARRLNIRVANISMRTMCDSDGSDIISQQIDYLSAVLGITVVVAHGNAGDDCGHPAGSQHTGTPAAAAHALTVAATNDQDTVNRHDDGLYSQYLIGPRSDYAADPGRLEALKPDLSAPGTGIFSAAARLDPDPGYTPGYQALSGTSQAAPVVAGAAAILLEARDDLDPASLKALLRATADKDPAWFAPDPNVRTDTADLPTTAGVEWDSARGAGILNFWSALQTAATADVGFPHCAGAPPGGAGTPCALTSGQPWENTMDIRIRDVPVRIDTANQVIAEVHNDGPNNATFSVSFGVYDFAVGNPRFHHLGTKRVHLTSGHSTTVPHDWTPTSAHQCVQVNIAHGFDTNPANNITQRNFWPERSVFKVQVENPFFVPARFHVAPVSERPGWLCTVDTPDFGIDPFSDCPRDITVTFHAPPFARPGDRARCRVPVFAVLAGLENEGPRLVGGVTIETYVPKRCRLIGTVMGPESKPIAGAMVRFREDSSETDADGVFSINVTPDIRQKVSVHSKMHGKGEALLSPTCGVGDLRFFLWRGKLEVVSEHDGRS